MTCASRDLSDQPVIRAVWPKSDSAHCLWKSKICKVLSKYSLGAMSRVVKNPHILIELFLWLPRKFLLRPFLTLRSNKINVCSWTCLALWSPRLGSKSWLLCSSFVCGLCITRTRLFKCIENFTNKNWKNSDEKLWYFSYFCSKRELWVHVRTASERRFLRVPTIYVFEQK